MRDVWHRIETWLAANAPDILESLCEPASDEDLLWAEAEIGCVLPADFIASHRIHDGAEGCGLLDYWDFLSLSEIVNAWKVLRDCADRGFFDGIGGEPNGPIRPDWWNRAWIPIAAEPGGNHHCIDLAPAEGGQVGQVILWYHDDSVIQLVSPNYRAWWERLASGLESRDIVLDPEGVLARVKPNAWK